VRCGPAINSAYDEVARVVVIIDENSKRFPESRALYRDRRAATSGTHPRTEANSIHVMNAHDQFVRDTRRFERSEGMAQLPFSSRI